MAYEAVLIFAIIVGSVFMEPDWIQNNQDGYENNNWELPERRFNAYVPDIPDKCKIKRFCEDVPNYPKTHVNGIIEQLGDARYMFEMEELLPRATSRMTYGSPDETDLCLYNEKVIVPQALPDKNGKWHFVVNKEEKPIQGFRVEVCESTASCNTNVAYFTNHTSHCKQKYILRQMTALDEKGNIIEKPLIIPSCCICVLKADVYVVDVTKN